MGKSNNQKKSWTILNKKQNGGIPTMLKWSFFCVVLLLPGLDPYCATAAALDGEKVAIPIPWSNGSTCANDN